MTRTYRWARRAAWGTLFAIFAFGCSPLTTIAFLFHRDTPNPAECPLVFDKDGPKKHKEEVVVALFVSPGSGQGYDFAGTDRALASEIAKIMPELAKENKQKLVVVTPSKVDKFKMQNPNWKLMHPIAWGKKLEADFVLDIHLDKMSLYKPDSQNMLYEGRAEVTVDTYDVDSTEREPKFNYNLLFTYPETGFQDATSIPVSHFKKAFVEHLAMKLAMKHVDHKASMGIAEDR
jgi:hypothetical protein